MNSGGGFFTGRWQSCNNSDIGVGFPTAGGSCESNSSNITTNAASWGDPGGGGASLWSSAAAAAPTPSHGGGGGAIPPFLYDGAPPEAGLFSQLFGDAAHQSPQNHHLHRSPSVYCASGGGGEGEGGGCGPHQLYLDPHLTCLRLGKGHYFEEAAAAAAAAAAAGASGSGGGTTIAHPPDVAGWCHVAEGFSVGLKRGRSPPAAAGCFFDSAAAAAVPRCQVDGCHVALVNAKDYHRRHKVCEMHAKAPRVEVLGVDKRFCQQCSRFHAVTEFDDAKRSCRRRLAGHNERRRKGSQDSCPKNPSQDKKLMAGGCSYLATLTGSALSLLSSMTDSQADLSLRSSAALRELIAENREAIMAQQLMFDEEWQCHDRSMEGLGTGAVTGHIKPPLLEPHITNQFHEAAETHVTLDLMHAPGSAFGHLSARGKSNREQLEGCPEMWNSMEGAHVV